MAPPPVEEYDLIFAGGGTAGCLVASRLADADPNLKILVVEAGPHIQDDLAHLQPARFLSHLHPESKVANFVVSNPEPHLGGIQKIVPTGHCVGGGSSINFMMYTRASASDYDDWENVYGNKGWGSKDLIPFLKKVETYEVSPDKHETHGYSGPLKVSYGGWYSNIAKDYLEAGPKYEKRGVFDDGNGLFECNKYARWPKWISQKDGMRSDVSHNFIYNKTRKNLTLVAGHLVKRVLFEYKRAVGIEFVENPRVYPNANGEVKTARARRLVVVSGGSLGSPAILERSGIGAKDVLEKAGVKQLVDLPGVGSEYQDHLVLFTPFKATPESSTIDGIVRNEEPHFEQWSKQWQKDGSGLMATNSIDVAIRLRPTEEEVKAIGPAFQQRWRTYYAPSPDKPIILHTALNALIGDPAGDNGKFFSMGFFTTHPTGRGWIHIRDGQNPAVQPEFVSGFLSTPEDAAVYKWAYKRTREIARRMACFRGEHASGHPPFAENSKVKPRPATGPVPINAPDLEYSEEDEKVLDEWLKAAVGTTWHSLGTCAMKPRQQGGVVDSNLNVYGVDGLKVCDLSVAPGNVAANTYSTALLIAEKGAAIIAEELGLTNFH